MCPYPTERGLKTIGGKMWIGLIVIAIGAVLLLDELGVIEGGLTKYWPVLLIAFGIGLVFNELKSKK